MPSAFAYLPPASHALWFIACYQQFTITMYFSPLLISLPYSSMRVTSRDGCSLNLLKLFILCFDFADSSTRSIILQPHKWSGYRVNLWIVFFSFALAGAKTPLQRKTLAYKSTAANASALFTGRTAKAVVNCCKVHATSFVSVVSRYLSHSLFNTY